MLEDLLKKKKANVRLEWCKDNNFEPGNFENEGNEDWDPNDLLF